MEQGERLISCGEVADILGVSVNTVWGWVRKGILRAYKIGRIYRIRVEDLEQFAQSKNETNPS